MAKKLNSMPDYQARMPRQTHDLSRSFVFTSSTGMLLPVYWHPLHLGDKMKFASSMFSRLNPLITATLGQIDFHFDYFFVPLSVMYTPAPSMFYQTDDLVSSAFSGRSSTDTLKNDKFPTLNYDSVLATLIRDTDGVNESQAFDGVIYRNDVFDCVGKAAYRLCDMIGISPYTLFGTSTSANPNSTPWALGAYHACYELYDGFRNSDRERKSYIYNFDKYFNTGEIIGVSDWFGLHYASAYKDYFNSIKVSPIGSSVSMLGKGVGQVSPWDLLSKVDSYIYDGTPYSRSTSDGTASSSIGSDNVSTSVNIYFSSLSTTGIAKSLNSANVRQLFMVDKLLRVVGRADKNYESQFLAHFGVKIPHDVLHNITHIGHDMVTMNPSPVISSAETFVAADKTGAALGEVGGQGQVSMSGKERHFEAPCHGIFMCIFHAVPRFRYAAGIDKLHDLSSPDKWWQPEFDRRGMQPVFGYEVLRAGLNQYGTERIGWQFGYEQFKRKYDRISAAFALYGSYENVSVNTYSPWVIAKTPFMIPGTYNPISDDYGELVKQTEEGFLSFLSTPKDLNMIMKVPYQTTWIEDLEFQNSDLLFQTDPFITDFHMDVKISNFMSEYSEPELD